MRFKKVYLEITDICNLACKFCPGTRREKKFMSVEEFSILSAKLRPYTDYLYFHIMGEPLLHPQLGTLLDTAGELGFRVILTSNGTLLPKCGDILLGSEALHKINISLQSFEANENSGFEDYIRSCSSFAEAAGKQGKICVLRLWNHNGFESLNGDIERLLEQSFPKPWIQSRQSLALADRVFLEPGDKFDWPDLSAEDRGERCFCYGLRDQLGVLCDGTVVPCCLDHEGDIPLGNLFDRSLDEILLSDRAKKIYDGFSDRKAVEKLCRRCGYARRFT